MNHRVEDIPAAVRTLSALWADHGREGRPQITIGAPATSSEDLLRAADAGIDRLIVMPWRRTRDALDGIARFAEQVMGPAAD